MPRFVLTAELNLQAPRNLRQVVSQMQSQLGTVNVNLAVRNGPQAQRQLGQLNSQMQQANGLANTLGRNIGVSVRRFVGFAIATRAVTLFTSGLANATKEAINFERELIKISQVTGNSISSLQSLENTITDLSTSLGTSSKSLLSATRILAQAGIEAARLDTALSALAKTTLAPTFENIEKTAEGAVAIIAQFGQGVGALEEQLGAINAVAGQFAVESGDLISVIRRTGGVFKAAGGDLNELIALFTSVRATTRESAESIATGLRTIFTRIQRPATIQFLKQLGVELTDLNGKFVGPYDAVRQLSKALSGLGEGDIRFVQIAEELGGFRQIGKVIPLLQQFETAEKARQAAIAGAGSLDKDAITAQKSLAVQLEKTREKFLALIRSVTETSTFQASIRTMLGLADSLIAVADAIKPLLPLLGALGAFSAIRGIAGFGRNFARGFSGAPAARNQGGPIGFATGGVVPGVGNSDTVPAMLTPGEFVIRKSSVKKIGADNLSAMNAKGYARGGVIPFRPNAIGGFFLNPPNQSDPRYKTYTGSEGTTGQVSLTNKRVIERLKAKGIYPIGEEAPKGVQVQQAAIPVKNLIKFAGRPAAKGARGAVTNTERSNLGISGLNQKVNTQGSLDRNSAIIQNMTPANRAKLENQYRAAQPTATVAPTGKGQKKGKGDKPVARYGIKGTFPELFPGGTDLKKNAEISRLVDDGTKIGLKQIVQNITQRANSILDVVPQLDYNNRNAKGAGNKLANNKNALTTVAGYVFEGLIQGLTGAGLAGEGNFFDFPRPSIKQNRKRLGAFFGDEAVISQLIKADAKRSSSSKTWESIIKKIGNDINKGKVGGILGFPPGFNKGGPAPSDTVPAMLTPGEFVINKKAAASIGRANLDRMNKQGVAGFAAGGPVAYLNQGGTTPSRFNTGALASVGFATAFIPKIEDATTSMERVYNSLLQNITTMSLLASAVTALTASENASNAAQVQDNVIDSQANGIEAANTEATLANTAVEQSLSTIIAANTAAIQANTVALGGAAATDVGAEAVGGAVTGGAIAAAGTTGTAGGAAGTAAGTAAASSSVFATVGKFLKPVAIAAAVAAAGVYVFSKAIDAARGVAEKAATEIKKGNTATAAAAAADNQQAKDSTTVAIGMAALAAGVTVLTGGTFALAAGVGVAVGGVSKFGSVITRATDLYRSVVGRLTGETKDVIKQRATQAAQQIKTEKELEEASKKTTKILEDFGKGAATVDQVFAALGSSVQAELDLINANIAYAEAQIRAEEGKFLGANEENVQESRGAIEKEQKKREELFSNKISEALSSDALRRSIENAVIGGGRVDPNDVLVKLFGGNLSLVSEDDKKKFIDSVNNMSAAAEENAAFLRSLNFGLRDVSSAIGATSLAVDTAVASFEPGFNSASLAAQTLGVAMTSAGANISQSSVDQSLQQLSQRFIDLGGDVESVKQLTGTISEITRIQRQAPDLIKNITDNLDLGGTAGPDLVENFQKGLLSLIPDNSPVKARFLDFFSTLEFDKLPDEIKKQIAAGNFEKLFDYSIKEISASAQEQVDAFEESAKVQDKLLPIIKKRIELEDKLASAQKESLKLQLEAAEAIEKFGGPAVTTAERLENLNAQLNVDLGNTGLGITATGSSPQELVRINRQLLAEYEKQTAAGARGGPQGVENEKQRENIEKANKSLVDNLRQRIKLSEQEVELAKKKNDLEKSALQKLIEGDTAGFLEEQRAAVAGRALRRGDSRLLGLLGAKEIAKGFASVQEDAGASDFEKRLAARLALGPGFASERNIDILTGITPEIQALQSAGMGAATALKEVADSAGKFIQADIQQVKGNILKVEGIIQNQEGGQQISGLTPTTLSRGGTVYANNGVFVPRGTDTVPAMLTPGEYVVNRDAVNKGNNLSILQAMNSGKTAYAKTGGLIANGVVYMSGGGLTPDKEFTDKWMSGGKYIGSGNTRVRKISDGPPDFTYRRGSSYTTAKYEFLGLASDGYEIWQLTGVDNIDRAYLENQGIYTKRVRNLNSVEYARKLQEKEDAQAIIEAPIPGQGRSITQVQPPVISRERSEELRRDANLQEQKRIESQERQRAEREKFQRSEQAEAEAVAYEKSWDEINSRDEQAREQARIEKERLEHQRQQQQAQQMTYQSQLAAFDREQALRARYGLGQDSQGREMFEVDPPNISAYRKPDEGYRYKITDPLLGISYYSNEPSSFSAYGIVSERVTPVTEEKLAIDNNLPVGSKYKKGTLTREEFEKAKSPFQDDAFKIMPDGTRQRIPDEQRRRKRPQFRSFDNYDQYLESRTVNYRENRSNYIQRKQAQVDATKESFYQQSENRYNEAERRYSLQRNQDMASLQRARAVGNQRQVERLERKLERDERDFNQRTTGSREGFMARVDANVAAERERRANLPPQEQASVQPIYAETRFAAGTVSPLMDSELSDQYAYHTRNQTGVETPTNQQAYTQRTLVGVTVTPQGPDLTQRQGNVSYSGYNDALIPDRLERVRLTDQPTLPYMTNPRGLDQEGNVYMEGSFRGALGSGGRLSDNYGELVAPPQPSPSDVLIPFSFEQAVATEGALDDDLLSARRLYTGGLVYASRGKLIRSIFKPRGTDTVPAMLTPGEFVVNRQAVNAGNNLAVLKAMNSQPASPVTMSKGGQVGGTQYLQNGGEVAGSSQDSSYLNALEDQLAKLAQKLETGFATFGQHVETFQGATQTEMAVNVNQTGSMRLEAGSTLSSSLMKNSKDIATASVNGQIDKTSLGMDGKLRTTGSVLGTA